jgi:hypothetical protein
MRGVVYAYVDKAFMRSRFAQHGSTVPALDLIADLNVASNFACLTLPGDPEGHNLPPACANLTERIDQERALERNQLEAALKPAVQKLITAEAAGHPDILGFGWNIASTNTIQAIGAVVQVVPGCVNRNAVERLAGTEFKIYRPFFYLRATYDQYLRAVNSSPIWAGFATTAENLRLSAVNRDSFQLDIADQASGQSAFNASLGFCQ